jgi:adenosylcobinamide-phosphate synthase
MVETGSGWYALAAAFILDLAVGDPRWLPHPVRWMGSAIHICEPRFKRISPDLVLSGFLFAAFLIVSTWFLTFMTIEAANRIHPLLGFVFETVVIFYCLSARSLDQAAMEIYRCLRQEQVNSARRKVALIVGRDVDRYDEEGIARATVETVAENLVDGVIAPLFFAAIGGAPLAMACKMSNTLDSMVGYKNAAYLEFGKASARIDDVFNYLPARLSVPVISLASQVLAGTGNRAFVTAVTEGSHHSSPNAGYAEACFAGALAVKLNGPNLYHGKRVDKPYIGVKFGKTSLRHIKQACDLMLLSSFLGLIFLLSAEGMIWIVN